jgi:hypothetical protein
MNRYEFDRHINERAWKDPAFKKELTANPKAAIEKELKTKLPDNVKIKMVEDSADTVHLVLRRNPVEVSAKGELTEEALDAAAGGTVIAGSWYLIVKLHEL